MTHLEQYNQIVNRRKLNPLPDDMYGEEHHIIPKSVCTILKDAPDNIVRLSAQEHFLAHYHLWLAYRDELHEKKWTKSMCFAFTQLKRLLVKCDDVEAMAKLYEEVKIDAHKLNCDLHRGKTPWNKGKKTSKETLDKMSMKLKGKKAWNKGLKCPQIRYWLGKQRSEDTKRKISEKLKGYHPTEETRKKISEANKGKPNYKLRGRPVWNSGIKTGLHWYNNGEISIQAKECPEGFKAGRIYKRKSKNNQSK